jgi:phytoene desaturase
MTQEKSDLSKKVVVIGGGLSGLSVAALMAHDGWEVLLIEKNKTLGGRARVLRKDGFAFDMGPSWYLMPEVFEKFFSIFGKKPSDFYELVRLNPRYKAFFGTKDSMLITDNIQENAKVFENVETGSGKKLIKFLKKMESVYLASTDKLMYEDVWDLDTWRNLSNWKSILKIIRQLSIWNSWDGEVKKYFKNDKLRKILGFPAVFLGGSPFNTPALYSILSWADFGKGVWYPKGGMGKVVEAIEKIAVQNGVRIITDKEVKEIVCEKGKVSGVKTDKDFYEADIVVSSCDLYFTDQILLKNHHEYGEDYWQNKQLGISAMLLYLGIDKKIDNLTHHNIYFSEDWEKNFTEIFDKKLIPEDPSFYVSVRSVTDKSIVPKDSEELFVLVPLGAGGTYPQPELLKLAQKVIDRIEKLMEVDIKNNLKVKEIYTPNDFSYDYNAYNGTALGLSHTLNQSLWFRPNNKSRSIKGLYYAGQYTNPGVGVPMALISAQIVRESVRKEDSDNDVIFKNGSVTYYYSSLFFTGQAKKDVFSLYAYVRVIDDLVDNPAPNKKLFESLWQQTLLAWNGETKGNKVVKGFVELAKRKKFEWKWIEAFWDAMRSDLTKNNYTSFNELENYMYGSADVIGLMMCKILDLPPAAGRYAALEGKAMQYLNFIRDVKEDRDMGRNYLGYTESQKNDPKLWEEFIRRNIEHYREIRLEAQKGYKYIPRKYFIPIKTASDMYEWTADVIYKNPDIVWQEKIRPKKRKVLIGLLKNIIFI